MTTPEHTPAQVHTEAASLAWYVAGKLTDSEHRQIAVHLASCAQCRAELQSVSQLRDEIRVALDAEPAPSPRARQAVMARIRSTQTVSEPAGFLARFNDWLRAPVVPRWAPAAALGLIVVQAGLLLRNAAPIETPTPPVTTRSIGTAATRLSVQFNSNANAAQIGQLLANLNARVVDGPSATGEYLIELAPTDPVLLAQKIAAARAQPEILLSLEAVGP